jgi:hypothetical protein
MKILHIALFLILSAFSLNAQSKSHKQWDELQKKFSYYLITVEDYEKAELYLSQMQKLVDRKFKSTDSLYAATVIKAVELEQARKYYVKGNEMLEKHIVKMRDDAAKGNKLSLSHYNFLLIYGNNCYYIAESLMFGRTLLGTDMKLPALPEEKFKISLQYFNKAIDSFTELKKRYPNHADADENIGAVYRYKGRLQGQFLGDLAGCISSLEKSLEYGEDLETYRLLGVANGIAGKHFKAIESFEKGLKFTSGPNAAGLLYNLEVAYRQLTEREPDPILKEQYKSKAESYLIQWKAADPSYDPRNGN